MKKEKEDVFLNIPVKDIVSESNRKNGGMGNIDVLVENIKQQGVINPPTVAAAGDGKYRVIAGRRRIEAIRLLKWETVTVKIVDETEQDRLASIALSENVNRMEMHPLDEAETFKKLLEKGTDIKDIAAYFDRSVAGIHHRVRLCNLREELKTMFREGKIKLSGAALLASLPDEDQERFAKKYAGKPVDNYLISTFIQSAQHCDLRFIADEQCEKCTKRTRNTTPGLFEEGFGILHDVCFDGECYAGKWQRLIAGLIAGRNDVSRTENNIIIDHNSGYRNSIPKFLPKKTGSMSFGETEYTLLPNNKYRWKETKKKAKTKTAYLIFVHYGKDEEVKIERVEYEEDDAGRRYGSYSHPPSDPVKEFRVDRVPDIAPGKQKEAAEKVKAKYNNSSYRFRNDVETSVLQRIILKRIREENRQGMAALYLSDICSGKDENTGEPVEFEDNFDRKIFNTIFGPDGITNIAGIPEEPLSEKLFLFIIASKLKTNRIPGLDDDAKDWAYNEDTLFWKFAQMTREEYIALYREILAAKVMACMKNEAAEEKPAQGEPEEPVESIEPDIGDEEGYEDAEAEEEE